jgi:ABC-2 type transport system permease protein
VKEHLRTLRTSAWLGWEYSSNWTEPWLFAVYSVIKPVAGTLILVFIYYVALLTGTGAPPEMLTYIYVGNAFYMFVFQAFFGMFEVIQGDREWFQTIRYIYISPISYYLYVVGRGFTQMAVAGVGVAVVLLFGHYLIPEVTLSFSLGALPFFLVLLALGLTLTVVIGVAIAGITFLPARHGGGMAEGIAGVFYVFTGVLFPLSVLPAWGETVGQLIPLTYWFEGVRRVLLPHRVVGDPFLLAIPDGILLAILAGSLVLFSLLSVGVFRYVEHLARKKGRIDLTTAY